MKYSIALLGAALVFATVQPALQAQEGVPTAAGQIAGRVVNTATGQEIMSAQVLIEGTQVGVLTSVGGRYLLRDLPAGTYSVRAQHLSYAPKLVTEIVVVAGETTELDIALDPQAVQVEGIEVTATVERGNTVALLNERQFAAGTLDAIGREEMSRTSDGDAGEALKRVPGLSVVDGKYAYVRGLGERYSSTSLNGAPLASPVPDRNVIPLDMFPTSLLESIVTSKSYTPDQPGDYAGGHVELRTRDYPLNREIKFSFSSGYNTATTGKDGLGYAGSGLDFLGFDDGLRELPALIPDDRTVRFGSGYSRAELETIGRSFGGDWGPTPETLRVPLSASLSIGDEAEIFGRRLGYVASVNWSDSPANRENYVERQYVGVSSAEPTAEIDYVGELTTRNVSVGGLLNAAYELSPGHELRSNLIYSRLTEDESRVLEGFNLDSNADQRNTRIRFLGQSMFNAQLEATHLFHSLGESLVDWRVGHTRAQRYEPNTREVLYRQDADDVFRFDDFTQSGSVFHQDLEDSGISAAFTVTTPFTASGVPASFKFGGSIQTKDRDVYTRRFRFRPGVQTTNEIRSLDPNDLLDPANISVDGFEINESTFRADNYVAADDRFAGFAMLDLSLTPRLRAVGGVRWEDSEQSVDPQDIGTANPTPLEAAELSSGDLLPALNLTFEVSESVNLRAGVSRTLARPELRELAPFGFADYAGGANVIGNPTLTITTIDNVDVRWEWFFRPGGIISASAFYKRFTDPIEVAILASTELLKTWVNAESAENYGLELEFRSDLGVLSESLEDVLINTNVTLIQSDVSTGGRGSVYLPDVGRTAVSLGDRARSLQGQSDYVLNASLTWLTDWGGTASVLFNRFGERIDAVGGLGLPDELEQARSQLDLVYEHTVRDGVSLKLSGTRLVGNVVTFEQFGEVLRQYDLGRSISASVSWEFGAS